MSHRFALLLRFAALGLFVLGALMCWPLVRTYLELTRSSAEILVIDAVEVGPDHVRIDVGYEFAVGKDRQIAWGQGNSLFRRMDEAQLPVLSVAEARNVVERLSESALLPVYFNPNDPAESAFILAVNDEHPYRRYFLALILVAVGLAFLTARSPET